MQMINGDWLTDVATESGLEYFVDQYEMSPSRFIVKYDLTRITRIGQGAKNGLEKIKYIAFLEYDGDPNEIITLDLSEGDRAYVYAEKRLDGYPPFSSSGSAFLDVHVEGEHIRSFHIDNSPYQLSPSDEEWEWLDEEGGSDGVISRIAHNYDIKDMTLENTIFVRQL
jgi:hypothetical protein